MMKKGLFHRLLCAVIAVCTLMLCLPASALTALAASGTVEYALEVKGVTVTSKNAADILGDGNFRYVNASKTLYMKGFNDFKYYTLTTPNGIKRYELGSIKNIGIMGLTICVEEDTILKAKILCYASTRITGPGKLVLTDETTEPHTVIVQNTNIESCDMYADITIENADINSTGHIIAKNLTVINSHVKAYKIQSNKRTLQGCHLVSASEYWPEIDYGEPDPIENPTEYGIRILNDSHYTHVTSNNYEDILGNGCIDGKFRYDPLTNTLYVSGETGTVIYNDKCAGLTIKAEGNASVSDIYLYADTTITGENKLKTTNDIVVRSGTLTVQDAQLSTNNIRGQNIEEGTVQRMAIQNSFLTTTGSIYSFGKLTVTDCFIEIPTGAEVRVSASDNLYNVSSSGTLARNIRIVPSYDKYGFSYGGTEVTALNVTEIFDGNAVYSPTENMLTVTGDLTDGLVNDSNTGLIINLAGSSTGKVDGMENISNAVVKSLKLYADTTIIGSGVLTGGTYVYNGAKLTFDHARVYEQSTICGNSTQESVVFNHSEVKTRLYLLDFNGGIKFDGCSMIAPQNATIEYGSVVRDGSICPGIDIRLPAHHYEIFVGDTEVTSHNYNILYTSDSRWSSGWVQYDPKTNTLKVLGKVDLSGCSSPTIRNEGAENLTVEFIPDGYEAIPDEYGDFASYEEHISVLVGGLDLKTNTVIKGGETENPARILPVSGNAVTVRSGAALTIDHAFISANGAVAGCATGESINVITSAVSCKSSDGVRSGVNGFSGGITFDDCGVKTPAGGNVSGSAILAANGDTILDGLTILPDEHYSLWYRPGGVLTQLTERNVEDFIELIAASSDDAAERYMNGEEIASYDGKTLTLNNVDVGNFFFFFRGGSNTLRVVGDCKFGSQIRVQEDTELTITGPGFLTASSNSAYIQALYNGKIIVKDTTVNSALKGDSDPECASELVIDNANINSAVGVGVFHGGITLTNASVTSPERYILDTAIYTTDGSTLATDVVITAKKKNLTNENVTLSQNTFAYTGKAVKCGSSISVKIGDTKLKYGTDFTLEYNNNVNIGYQTATVTVVGMGNYTGSVTKEYSIVPVQQAKPTLTYKDSKMTIAWTADANTLGYHVQFCKNSSFTGSSLKELYLGKSKTSAEITTGIKTGEKWYVRVRSYIKDPDGGRHGIWSSAANITLADPISTVTLSKSTFPYTGKAVKVGSYITVKSGDTKLKYGDDFTMTYSENIECGVNTAKVTVNGIGKYTGTITKKYTIVPAQQAKPTLNVKNGKLNAAWAKDTNAQGYQVQYSKDSSFSSYKLLAYATKTSCELPEPALGEKWYVRVRSYIKGSDGKKYGIWSESSVKTLTLPIDSVTLSKSSFAYTGSQVKIGSYIAVKSGDTKLKYGTDFTMTYSENVECGVNTAKVTVKGTGKYSGTISKTYTIYPAQQAAPKLSTVSGKLHAAWTKDTNAQGYQVQYCQNKDFTGDTLHSSSFAATATNGDLKYGTSGSLWYVRVRAYITSSSGTKYGEWSEVSSLKVGKLSTVTLSQSTFTYTGNPIKVGSYITVKSGNTKLKYGTDFTLSYKNNTAKGTATVTVTGIGEYSGSSLTKEYQIK